MMLLIVLWISKFLTVENCERECNLFNKDIYVKVLN